MAYRSEVEVTAALIEARTQARPMLPATVKHVNGGFVDLELPGSPQLRRRVRGAGGHYPGQSVLVEQRGGEWFVVSGGAGTAAGMGGVSGGGGASATTAHEHPDCLTVTRGDERYPLRADLSSHAVRVATEVVLGHVMVDGVTVMVSPTGVLSAPGAGVSAFTGLSDVPTSYTGHGGKLVRVNAGATALEFFSADYAATAHTHDDRYYTETEVEGHWTAHLGASDPHPGYLTVAEADAAYQPSGSYAASAHVHNASDVNAGTLAIARLPVATSGTASATEVVRADDTRLSNARVPTAHAASHSPVGSDTLMGYYARITGEAFTGGVRVPALMVGTSTETPDQVSGLNLPNNIPVRFRNPANTAYISALNLNANNIFTMLNSLFLAEAAGQRLGIGYTGTAYDSSTVRPGARVDVYGSGTTIPVMRLLRHASMGTTDSFRVMSSDAVPVTLMSISDVGQVRSEQRPTVTSSAPNAAPVTVSNSTVETTIVTQAVAGLRAAQRLRVAMAGSITWSGIPGGYLVTFRLKNGATTLATWGSRATFDTAANWTLDATMTVRTLGAPGTQYASGRWADNETVPNEVLLTGFGVTSATNNNVTALTLTMQWSAAGLDNTITVEEATIEFLN
jgi:hypothetical protein